MDPLTGLGWHLAQGDPVAGPVLRLLHDDPAHPWTVAQPPARVGASPAPLARRFIDLVVHRPQRLLPSATSPGRPIT